jgi:hypothetical protein
MKLLYAALFVLTLAACGGSKTIYQDNNINDKKLDKLIRDYSANPSDTSVANQLRFAYEYLLGQRMVPINQLQFSSSLEDKEKLLNAYIDLQAFYDKVRSYSAVSKLLQPGSVGTEIEKTKLDLVSGHYENALKLLEENKWKSSRDAYQSLSKIQQWMPGYKDSKKLLLQARESGTIIAVVLPLHAEGMYYPNNNIGSGLRYAGNRLSEQLVSDLGGSYNSSGWYKVYNSYELNNKQITPDWSIDPVWTQLRINEPRYTNREEVRQRQIEVGKDTANRPIYKTVTATLKITTATYDAYGTLEVRIGDYANKQNISRMSWNENYTATQSWATYTGEAGALSNADWELINARNNNNRPDQYFAEDRLLEKIYPNLLRYVRSQLNN